MQQRKIHSEYLSTSLFYKACWPWSFTFTVFVFVPQFHNRNYSIKYMTGQTWWTCVFLFLLRYSSLIQIPRVFNLCASLTYLTLTLLTWRIWWAPNNASRWQMRFNSAFKGLRQDTEAISSSFRKGAWKYFQTLLEQINLKICVIYCVYIFNCDKWWRYSLTHSARVNIVTFLESTRPLGNVREYCHLSWRYYSLKHSAVVNSCHLFWWYF